MDSPLYRGDRQVLTNSGVNYVEFGGKKAERMPEDRPLALCLSAAGVCASGQGTPTRQFGFAQAGLRSRPRAPARRTDRRLSPRPGDQTLWVQANNPCVTTTTGHHRA